VIRINLQPLTPDQLQSQIKRRQSMAWRRENPERWKEMQRQYRGRNKAACNARIRDNYYRRAFGIPAAEADRSKQAQAVCAICADVLKSGQASALDHCHKHGHIRAWLCRMCNLGLGKFRDRPELLRAAAEYLETHAPEKTTAV
jgi:hypothetical protein